MKMESGTTQVEMMAKIKICTSSSSLAVDQEPARLALRGLTP